MGCHFDAQECTCCPPCITINIIATLTTLQHCHLHTTSVAIPIVALLTHIDHLILLHQSQHHIRQSYLHEPVGV